MGCCNSSAESAADAKWNLELQQAKKKASKVHK